MKTRRQFFSTIAAAVGIGAAAVAIPKAAVAGIPGVNYHDMIAHGLISVGEVRAAENLNPLPVIENWRAADFDYRGEQA